MNKKPYGYLDGIPDKISDLYNDVGFIDKVDTTVTEDSPNAVTSGAVYDAIADTVGNAIGGSY